MGVEDQQDQQQENNEQPPANEEQQSQGHPAWQPVLDALNELPDDFKAVVEPQIIEELKKWDQGVQGKLQDVNSKYDPYKPLVENNIPIDRVEQALWLAHQLENNPQEVIDKAIHHYQLGYVPANQAQNNSNDPDENEDDDLGDVSLEGLENHPAFKQLQQMVNTFQQQQEQQQQQQEQQTAAQQLETYLTELHEEHGDFNDLYVTALMAQGADAVEAIKEYQADIQKQAQAMVQNVNQNEQPPVVMGEEGTAGSGVPSNGVDFGSMSDNDVSDLVANMIAAGNTNP